MRIREFPIEGIVAIEPDVFTDNRGYFFESFSKKKYENDIVLDISFDNNSQYGIQSIVNQITFVQDNESFSKRGTLRGLHWQNAPFQQAKLVRVISGNIIDVAVDLRPGSKTYGKWEGVILTEENKKMFMIPRGFAHGFLVLSDEAEFAYKCDDIYNHEAEGGLKWDDPDIGIKWPMGDLKPEDLLTSEKDGKWPSLKELKETDLFSNL